MQILHTKFAQLIMVTKTSVEIRYLLTELSIMSLSKSKVIPVMS